MQDFITTEYNAILQTLQQNLAETTGVDSTLQSFISPEDLVVETPETLKLPTKKEVAEKEKRFIEQLSKKLGRPATQSDIEKELSTILKTLQAGAANLGLAGEAPKNLLEVAAFLGFGKLVKTQ